MPVRRSLLIAALALCFATVSPTAVRAASPEGTLTIGVHVTLVNRWLDPGETEALITPFMVLYALHDALVKPMPAGINTPSLAESWTLSKDGLEYEFVLRKGTKVPQRRADHGRRREVLVRPLPGQWCQTPQGAGARG